MTPEQQDAWRKGIAIMCWIAGGSTMVSLLCLLLMTRMWRQMQDMLRVPGVRTLLALAKNIGRNGKAKKPEHG